MIKNLARAIAAILIFNACANITTPIGGPKDIAPPKLVESSPSNKQINFSSKTVELTFNEAVKLNNPKEEIIITPSPGEEIDFRVKQTKLLITPKEGWQPETTYSIQFREGVKDITEGNVPINLKLAFSTGPNIDSLRFSGKIYELLKGTPTEKITVAIYEQDTFDLFTDKPLYFTKTDKNGKFTLDNIKNGSYYFYAWDDKNKNLKVESKTERYGFIGQKLELQKNIDTLNVGLVMLDARQLKITSIRNIGTVTRVRSNKFLTDYTIESDSSFTNNFGETQTEVNIWNPQTIGDSVRISFVATDSLQTRIDSTFYIKKTNTKPIIDTYLWSLGAPAIESETGIFKTTIRYNKPITYINFDSLFIVRDTIEVIPITKEDISIDIKHKKIEIEKNLDKNLFKAEVDPLFKLKAGKGFLLTIDDDTSKMLSIPVPILWPEDTGTLLIETNTTSKHFIIELLTSDFKIISSIRDAKKYTFKNILPGSYQLRIIIDSNNNGVWDPGNIVVRKEPEKVIFYIGLDKKPLVPLRANWEVGPLTLKF